jgi:hypothetical protein
VISGRKSHGEFSHSQAQIWYGIKEKGSLVITFFLCLPQLSTPLALDL